MANTYPYFDDLIGEETRGKLDAMPAEELKQLRHSLDFEWKRAYVHLLEEKRDKPEGVKKGKINSLAGVLSAAWDVLIWTQYLYLADKRESALQNSAAPDGPEVWRLFQCVAALFECLPDDDGNARRATLSAPWLSLLEHYERYKEAKTSARSFFWMLALAGVCFGIYQFITVPSLTALLAAPAAETIAVAVVIIAYLFFWFCGAGFLFGLILAVLCAFVAMVPFKLLFDWVCPAAAGTPDVVYILPFMCFVIPLYMLVRSVRKYGFPISRQRKMQAALKAMGKCAEKIQYSERFLIGAVCDACGMCQTFAETEKDGYKRLSGVLNLSEEETKALLEHTKTHFQTLGDEYDKAVEVLKRRI